MAYSLYIYNQTDSVNQFRQIYPLKDKFDATGKCKTIEKAPVSPSTHSLCILLKKQTGA